MHRIREQTQLNSSTYPFSQLGDCDWDSVFDWQCSQRVRKQGDKAVREPCVYWFPLISVPKWESSTQTRTIGFYPNAMFYLILARVSLSIKIKCCVDFRFLQRKNMFAASIGLIESLCFPVESFSVRLRLFCVCRAKRPIRNIKISQFQPVVKWDTNVWTIIHYYPLFVYFFLHSWYAAQPKCDWRWWASLCNDMFRVSLDIQPWILCEFNTCQMNRLRFSHQICNCFDAITIRMPENSISKNALMIFTVPTKWVHGNAFFAHSIDKKFFFDFALLSSRTSTAWRRFSHSLR